MKNSPHHRKHLQHKAVREANKISLYRENPKKQIKPISLILLDTKRSERVLNLYKKHLERARLIKGTHHSKGSTPGEIVGKPYTLIESNPNKMTAHWKSSDMERTKQLARKMLKASHKYYKKAA